MSQTLFFLGRFHVVVLHLPIGILLLAAVAEVLSRRSRFAYLQASLGFLWLAGACAALVTVALGLLHAGEGGFDRAALLAHGTAGGAVAVLAWLVWALRIWLAGVYRRLWLAGVVGMLLLLTLTGHLGGNLTHGDTYLLQYAPAAIKRFVGPQVRERPSALASADLYLDIVAPAFEQRCVSCHNQGKRKGELDLSGYAAVMKGGAGGAVVVAGKPAQSDLFRRISLSHDDKDFMPHDGKTPLTPDQTEAIGWWIQVGAPATAQMASLQPPPPVHAALERILGFAPAVAAVEPQDAAAANTGAPVVDVPPADPAVLERLANLGFELRPVAKDSPLLNVDYTSAGALGKAQLDELARIGPQIYTLNLRSAGVVDAQLATIGRFEHLSSLRLELNPVTDAGLAALLGLHGLRSLNLYGTRITDRGLASLARLDGLEHLYLWQTAVTAAGVAGLHRAHAGLVTDLGFDPRNFPVGPKVLPIVN